jgi:hypothetical protein
MYFLHEIVMIFCWFWWSFLDKSWFFRLFCATLSRKFDCFVVSHDLSLEINQNLTSNIWQDSKKKLHSTKLWKSENLLYFEHILRLWGEINYCTGRGPPLGNKLPCGKGYQIDFYPANSKRLKRWASPWRQEQDMIMNWQKYTIF